jgi:multisubunit Na+/H+ antiporter MnhB subunit
MKAELEVGSLFALRRAALFAAFLALVLAAGVAFLGGLAAGHAFLGLLVVFDSERAQRQGRESDGREGELEDFHGHVWFFFLPAGQ